MAKNLIGVTITTLTKKEAAMAVRFLDLISDMSSMSPKQRINVWERLVQLKLVNVPFVKTFENNMKRVCEEG